MFSKNQTRNSRNFADTGTLKIAIEMFNKLVEICKNKEG